MTRHAAAVVTVNLLAAHDAVRRRLADERGQGTVEYVALILLVSAVLAAVVVWARGKDGDTAGHQIGKAVIDQLKGSVDNVGATQK
jgi:Flp pilus assembly pilin Flp